MTYLVSRRAGPQRSLASQLQRLRRVPFFTPLGPKQLEQIAKVIRELRVPANAYIIREQRQGESMYVVLSGQLHILKRGTHDETLLQTVGPGDVIGEMALLNESRRIASARAITPCVLIQIDRDDFFALLNEHAEIAEAVWSACETHAIELAAADHAKTRALSLPERRAWIDARQSRDVQPGPITRPTEQHVYLAVITGAVESDGMLYEAPALLRVLTTQTPRAVGSSRICWLQER